ncbi:BMP family ABC transporter substrate-binding protein [Cohnella sp. AR92]|uniref:BMP family ABC transporter substrate-binding protein n=1 Tax=Cohnella sp. AR92 TaxID=648716 RepID=UPI000F8EF019|nr:BMP family ABC transporter substrate-binding protein [Cohnella sp. AR92]RUS48733.1 BMP family ABC transporter substrate-binding protein [Cohnella sp. AR92]
MRKGFVFIVLALLLVVTACSNGNNNSNASESASPSSSAPASSVAAPSADAEKKVPRVAFVYIGEPGDGGWTYQHDLARIELEKKYGFKATVVENVPEGADAERVFTELAQSNDLIIGTSFGYMDSMASVASKFPKVKFLHASGYKTGENLSTYAGRAYQTAYLVGVAAGKMTKNNHLGYVGAYPIPEVIYTINAFTLGAQSVNPDIDVSVVWSNTWYDPTIERQAAVSLLDQGVDVLANYQDSPAGIQAAAERKVYSIGNDSDMNKYAPDYYISNTVYNWFSYYDRNIQEIMDGTWKSESYWGSLQEGLVDLAPLGKNVPQDVKDLVEQKKKEMADGKIDVFGGQLFDQNGKEIHADGQSLSDEDILNMNWFVKGVKGSIPS